jgi:hypothetical protein
MDVTQSAEVVTGLSQELMEQIIDVIRQQVKPEKIVIY